MMKDKGKNAGALSAMVKGEKPYDQATVDAALAQFEDTAKNLPTLFPESMKGLEAGGRLRSLAEDLGRQGRLRVPNCRASPRPSPMPKARSRMLDTLKAALPVIGKQCGGCHETYRVKKG